MLWEQQRAILAMTPSERVDLALQPGEEAVRIVMSAQGISREEAMRRIRRQNRAGRTPSRCMDEE